MSETDVTENTVTGGKVWNPLPDPEIQEFQKICKRIFLGLIAVVGIPVLALFIWQAFFGIPVENTPETMTTQDFTWFRWYELALVPLAGIVFFIAMAYIDKVLPGILVFVFVLMPSIANLHLKENRNEINAWAAQYGYEFHAIMRMQDEGMFWAKNLKTGKRVGIEVVKHKDKIRIVGAKKIVSEDETESLDLNDLEVVINDGKQTFVDITTEKTYTVKVDGLELHLETGK